MIRAQAEKQGFYYMEGILDIVGQDGYGFYGQSIMDQVQKISIFLPHKSDDSVWEMGTKWQEKPVHLKNRNVIMVWCTWKALMEKIRRSKRTSAFSSLNTSLSAKTASTGNNTAKTIYPNDRYLFSNRFWSAWIDRRTAKSRENFCIKKKSQMVSPKTIRK